MPTETFRKSGFGLFRIMQTLRGEAIAWLKKNPRILSPVIDVGAEHEKEGSDRISAHLNIWYDKVGTEDRDWSIRLSSGEGADSSEARRRARKSLQMKNLKGIASEESVCFTSIHTGMACCVVVDLCAMNEDEDIATQETQEQPPVQEAPLAPSPPKFRVVEIQQRRGPAQALLQGKDGLIQDRSNEPKPDLFGRTPGKDLLS